MGPARGGAGGGAGGLEDFGGMIERCWIGLGREVGCLTSASVVLCCDVLLGFDVVVLVLMVTMMDGGTHRRAEEDILQGRWVRQTGSNDFKACANAKAGRAVT